MGAPPTSPQVPGGPKFDVYPGGHDRNPMSPQGDLAKHFETSHKAQSKTPSLNFGQQIRFPHPTAVYPTDRDWLRTAEAQFGDRPTSSNLGQNARGEEGVGAPPPTPTSGSSGGVRGAATPTPRSWSQQPRLENPRLCATPSPPPRRQPQILNFRPARAQSEPRNPIKNDWGPKCKAQGGLLLGRRSGRAPRLVGGGCNICPVGHVL